MDCSLKNGLKKEQGSRNVQISKLMPEIHCEDILCNPREVENLRWKVAVIGTVTVIGSPILSQTVYVKTNRAILTLEKETHLLVPKTKNIDAQSNQDAHEKNLIKLWKNHCDKLKQVEMYTGLQLMLQAPAESLVLQDRLCWMQEEGLNAKIVPVMNRNLSPRAYAIVSQKR